MLRKASLVFCLFAASAFAHEYSGPQGSVVLDWKAPNVSRVVSSGYGDSFGMEAAVKMGFPASQAIADARCVSGSYFLFDVDDAFAFDIDETVEVEVLLDRRNVTELAFAYDRNAIAETLMTTPVPPGARRMVTLKLELPRARFANRGEAGTDLMIGGSSVYFPGVPDDNHNIVLCGLEIKRSNRVERRQPSGTVKLNITDEHGKRSAARIGIYDESGRMPLPSEDALTVDFYDDKKRQIFLRNTHGKITPWPHDNRYVFYIDGHYEASLPVGTYTLVVAKGPEYRWVNSTFSVRMNETTEVNLNLERFADMPAAGWYSGDDHVHWRRNVEDNKIISRVMSAEDIHVTNVLQMGNPANPYFQQYAFGEEGRYFDGEHGLVSGIEDPRTALRGHTISLNIQEVVRTPEIYIQYDRVFAEYQKQGAISGYAHVAGEWFNAPRGLALDVPLGGVDFIEVLQDGQLGTHLWYDFLNLGFALVPTAGSDYPYLNQPGAERNFVRVDGTFSADAWFRNLAAGRTYVSNGPLLTFDVNGNGMGETIEAETGDSLTINASVRLNPDLERLDRLELVVSGEVVTTVMNAGNGDELTLAHDLTVEHGAWIAVRAFGTTEMAAHSTPVYVQTDARGFRSDDAIPAIVERMLARIGEFETAEIIAGEELEVWEAGPPLEKMLKEQRTQILDQVERARSVYGAILKDTQTWH